MKSCTTILSKVLVRTGVIDIGRKSECCVGAVTFGRGLGMKHTNINHSDNDHNGNLVSGKCGRYPSYH